MARMFGGMLVASAMAFIFFSLPRGGKLARFTGTPWESADRPWRGLCACPWVLSDAVRYTAFLKGLKN